MCAELDAFHQHLRDFCLDALRLDGDDLADGLVPLCDVGHAPDLGLHLLAERPDDGEPLLRQDVGAVLRVERDHLGPEK